MGAPITVLVKSFVDNSIMPFIGVLVPSGDWKTATLALGPVNLGIGSFLAECINFIVIALVVFMIAKKNRRRKGREKVKRSNNHSYNPDNSFFISSKKPGYKCF
ncbi:MscL family protein [Methanospirillum hungatei]|nr:MscL family protein [Methanospirillum hungatei]